MNFLNIQPNTSVNLAVSSQLPEQVHVFDQTMIDAVNAALAARRPLLIRGEPGTGKSQLARATAKVLGRVYLEHVVDVRTESKDLLWHFDAVARLAEAQFAGVFQKKTQLQKKAEKDLRTHLNVGNYLHPGILWWAFDWEDASRQAKRVGAHSPLQQDSDCPEQGCVVLVDEIDKAESDVPNGLLEALGARQFTPMGRSNPVRATGIPPLVIVTTNEERALPDAFVRRCLVLFLSLPKDRNELISLLMARGRAHFPGIDDDVLQESAKLLAEDREEARRRQNYPLPGQAEHLDLVRAVRELKPDNPYEQMTLLGLIRNFVLKKSVAGGQ
jgi:MoxR-like ATPase